ncbi:MAG: ABC transporter permease, partial [Planctomycetota bacterium]|nr:ABC transporter permease [Planctomycetota bacterium]
MYKYFLAFRYLRRRLVSILAVLGIAVGVMVLLVVTSVMGGFARDLKAKLRGVSAHLSLKAPQGRFIYNYELLCERLEKIPNVVAVAPRLEWPALFGEQCLGSIIGIDPDREGKTTDFNKFLLGKDPGFKPDPFDLGRPPMIMGHTVSPRVNRAEYECPWETMEWQVFTARPVHDKGRIIATGLRARPSFGPLRICLVPRSVGYLRSDHWTRRLEQRDMKFVVSGAYSSGMSEFDNANWFVPLRAAQDLVAGPDAVTRICVAVTDYEDPKVMDSVKEAAEDLARQFPGILVQTWEEEKQTLLNAVQMERRLNAIILFFIVL